MPFKLVAQEHSTGVGVSSFATNMHLEPPNPASATLRGELYVAAIVNSPDARLGKELRELVTARYYSEGERSPFEALSSSLGEVVHLFRQKQTPVEISAAALVDNVVYLVAANGAIVHLIRDGVLVPILGSEESEVKSASGYLQEGDIILLTTHAVTEVVSKDRLQYLLNEVSAIDELKEAVIDEMVGYKRPYAFNLIQVNQVIVPTEEVEEEQAIVRPAESNLRKRITSGLDKVISLIPEKKVIVHEETLDGISEKKSKVPILVGLFLLVGLLVSIWFGMRAREQQQRKLEYLDELRQAQHQFQESQSLAGINASRAKELILSAKHTVDQLQDRGVEDEELNVLGASITQNMGLIAGIYNQPPETFLDLTLIRADFQGSDLAFSDGVIRVLDAANERMTLINAGSKKTENIAGLDIIPNAIQATAYADESFILSNDGIREVQSEIELVVKDEEWNADSVLIAAFGGNLYVLDKENNKIWRYPGGINSYGEGQEWFAPGITVDVTSGLSWAIDGKVWILKEGGDVVVYERGLPQRFSMDGVDSIEGFKQLFTDETASYLYLLDTFKSRIVVLEKTGGYKGEYQVAELAKATDFVVSEVDKKIIFLSENKLFEIPLQH